MQELRKVSYNELTPSFAEFESEASPISTSSSGMWDPGPGPDKYEKKVAVDYTVLICVAVLICVPFVVFFIRRSIRIRRIRNIPEHFESAFGELEIKNNSGKKCHIKVKTPFGHMEVVDLSISQRFESMYEGEITDYIHYDYRDQRWARRQTEFHIQLDAVWPVFMVRPLGRLERNAINAKSIIHLRVELHDWALLTGLDKEAIEGFATKEFQVALNQLKGATIICYGDVLRLYFYGQPLRAEKIKNSIHKILELLDAAPKID